MSDDESPRYKDGDVVWVKLGPCWWPGEVTEKGPEDFAPKKPPLAIVKFFNEDTYEFVKSTSHIYLYNCERKNEFIRKGMDSFRGNNPHMEKFPGDVSLAEIRTDGNPNILSEPQFSPQKKTTSFSELFGQHRVKKTPKDSPRHSQGHSKKKSSAKKGKVNITHRRFLGCDDYEAHIRVQFPGKDTDVNRVDDEIIRLNTDPAKKFNCSSCAFETSRLEVMLFHVQCHIKGVVSPMPLKKKPPAKKKKKRIFKHITSDDDVNNSSATYVDSDSEEEVKAKPKRKKRTTTSPRKVKAKKEVEDKQSVAEIRTNLLAEWIDSDDQEDEDATLNTSSELNDTVKETTTTESPQKDNEDDSHTKQDLNKSCFDFDEDEEEGIVQATTAGRKIPRVIPPSDKRKSDGEDDVAEDAAPNPVECPNDADVAKDEDEFKDLMEATAVPDLPDVPETAKTAPSLPEAKKSEPSTEVATKLTNPKKRFVKSFEDFELLQNEQRRAQEEREEELKKEKVVAATSKNFPHEEAAPVGEGDTCEGGKSITEDAKSETDEDKSVAEAAATEIDKEVQNEGHKELDNLQISKLKCQVMSKLGDEEPEPARSPSKRKSHRTPRSKILESYKKNESKRRKSEEKSETKCESEKDVEDASVAEAPQTDGDVKVSEAQTSVEDASETDSSPRKSQNEENSVGGGDKSEEEVLKSEVIKEIEAIPEKNSDEEIGKISQIDEYLNDFLFDIPKKAESEEAKQEEKSDENEVHVKCPGSNESSPGLDIAIKTNLTNFNKDEEMSALSTLAMVSQLEPALEEPSEEKSTTTSEETIKLPFADKPEPELVPIDGNLTVVSEKDLADKQVEITAQPSSTCKKPVTLTSFSMDFSECNSSNSDSVLSEPKCKPAEDDVDVEEHIPSQVVDKPAPKAAAASETPPPTTSKLLERLTTPEAKSKENVVGKSVAKVAPPQSKTKFVIKSASKVIKAAPSKPIILSEKIIKPGRSKAAVSVQKIQPAKRNLQDLDDIDKFIIQREAVSADSEDGDEVQVPVKRYKRNTPDAKRLQATASAIKKRGKANILQQTIITPAGEIIQPAGAAATASTDDNVFDINSMPIVLSDQILTPESIENMPIYLSDSVQANAATEQIAATPKVQKKSVVPVTVPSGQMRVLNKAIATPGSKLVKANKILGSIGPKLIKHNSLQSGRQSKYVIVTQAASPATTTSKYTVGKKQAVVKGTTSGTLTKVQNVTSEPSGNKIMILTNQQGQQQRVLLTPAQQKMMGYQNPGAKVTKTVVKGNILQKTKDGQLTAIAGSSGLITTKSVTPSRFTTAQTLISSSGQVLTPIQQSKTLRLDKSSPTARKIQMQSQKVPIKPPAQRTILIKDQHGHTVRKIQGTDDALLDKQVAEQIEAIKASGVLQQKQEVVTYKGSPQTTPARTIRRSYMKKVEPPSKPKLQVQTSTKTEAAVPPLAPISPKKSDLAEAKNQQPERSLHQLVIQDAMGNQTTITEGQILALPSETIDGQPQSYMLVTLDESGNLTPLNNEALLSLDPNLGLGGDLGNTVLQIDQSALKQDDTANAPAEAATKSVDPVVSVSASEAPPAPQKEEVEEKPQEEVHQEAPQELLGVGGESGQQLIVTGDPIAAQKFLESLTEGNTDLANILASAEGSSIIIHADGQQILINTDADNQMLLSVNTDSLNSSESTEGGGNPIFATQPKNQDILAAALADTDVFQQEQNGGQGKVAQLSPGSALYPMNVGNVLETSLTLNSPIMTPLEVPSTNTKKISDESDILGQVPKNVDLPITITDPNIAQTVSQQQVASMMAANDLQTNLELSLPIGDSAIAATSSEMNSPSSFVYSLPSLESSIDMNQKPFNSSMPLLTCEEDKTKEADKSEKGTFLEENDGLCTLGGEMCSSLSEPPPDMFDLSAVLSHQIKNAPSPKNELGEESVSSESMNTASVTETSSPNTLNEDSCEIPVQPEIVASLEKAEKRSTEEDADVGTKKCKFD